MALLQHLNTYDLLDIHPDLMEDVFPHQYIQSGTDGKIVGTTVPCTFKSDSGNFMHYVNEDSGTLNNTKNRVQTRSDGVSYMLPTLNIDNVGFFRIKNVVSNVEVEIEYMSPNIQLIINRGLGLNLDTNSITEATGLKWTLGGWEEKIAVAYSDLLSALIKRNAVTGSFLDSNDPSYIEALRYHALQLVYVSLIVDPNDNSANLAASYYQLYQKELILAKPYGYTKRATKEFTRC